MSLLAFYYRFSNNIIAFHCCHSDIFVLLVTISLICLISPSRAYSSLVGILPQQKSLPAEAMSVFTAGMSAKLTRV